MNAPFAPKRADAIADWAKKNGSTEPIARRFIQAAALYVIAGDAELAELIHLYGSAALSILYGTSRTAVDLDFWFIPERITSEAAKEQIRERINRCLNQGLRQFVPFDPYWREVLASQIKIQLCKAEMMRSESHQVTLDYDPPRNVKASTARAILGRKLVSPMDGIRARPHDVYDVADAILRLGFSPDEIVSMGRVALSASERVSRETTAMLITQTRAGYEAKVAAGEYDIGLEEAWTLYIDLLRQVPGCEFVKS